MNKFQFILLSSVVVVAAFVLVNLLKIRNSADAFRSPRRGEEAAAKQADEQTDRRETDGRETDGSDGSRS